MYPPDWNLVTLGEISQFSQYGINSPSGEGNSYPMLRMNNIKNGMLDTSDLAYVLVSDEEFERFRLISGDILINRTNSYDLVGKSTIFQLEQDFVFASYLVRFRMTTNADPLYVHFYLNSQTGQDDLRSLATKGVSQANINPTTLKQRLKIPLPPLPEQRKIAAILSTWDEAITLTRRLIEALQQRKRALMDLLLTGRVRFPGYQESDEYQQTDFGTIPSDWEYVPIGHIAVSVSDVNANALDLPVLSCTKYEGLVDSLSYFGRQIYSDDLSTYKLVNYGQFAYATNHIEEGSIGYQNLYDVALISPMYTVFETTDRVNDAFLYYVLKTETYRHLFEANTSASVNRRGSLRWTQFSKLRVPLPKTEEQELITNVIGAAEAMIDFYNTLRLSLESQKRGLMQQLLTGAVRVQTD